MTYGMNGWNHDNDLVRRKDVMDSMVKEYNRRHSLGERNGLKLAWIEKAVNEVDVAQPERMRGKWIYGEDEYGIDGYHCNQCGFFVPWDYAHRFINYIEDYHFCPNCGADMREHGRKRNDS